MGVPELPVLCYIERDGVHRPHRHCCLILGLPRAFWEGSSSVSYVSSLFNDTTYSVGRLICLSLINSENGRDVRRFEFHPRHRLE